MSMRLTSAADKSQQTKLLSTSSEAFVSMDRWLLRADQQAAARTAKNSAASAADAGSYSTGSKPLWKQETFTSEFVLPFVNTDEQPQEQCKPNLLEEGLLPSLDLMVKILMKTQNMGHTSSRIKEGTKELDHVIGAMMDARVLCTEIPIASSRAIDFHRFLSRSVDMFRGMQSGQVLILPSGWCRKAKR